MHLYSSRSTVTSTTTTTALHRSRMCWKASLGVGIATALNVGIKPNLSMGCTAFIGVDEYDAPANACLVSASSDRDRFSARKEEIDWLEIRIRWRRKGILWQICGEVLACRSATGFP